MTTNRSLRLAVTILLGAGALSVGNVLPLSATRLTTACALFSNNNPSNFSENVSIAFSQGQPPFPGLWVSSPSSTERTQSRSRPGFSPLTFDSIGLVDHSRQRWITSAVPARDVDYLDSAEVLSPQQPYRSLSTRVTGCVEGQRAIQELPAAKWSPREPELFETSSTLQPSSSPSSSRSRRG